MTLLQSFRNAVKLFFGSGDFSNIVDSLIKHYTHSGMTGETREEMDYENDLFVRNWDERTGPRAQVNETALGFDDVGLNRMLMAGNQPGATASSPSAPASNGSDLLGGILNTVLRAKQVKNERDIAERSLDIQDKLADASIRKQIAEASGQETYNLFAPQLFQGQVDNLKDALRNNVVQRNLWRSDITANEARAALDRSSAWLNSIESRIKTADANTRDQFNYLTNQLYYWSVESAKVGAGYAKKFAEKQLELVSGQIAHLASQAKLFDEQVYSTQIGYMQGWQQYKMNQPAVRYSKFKFWNDVVANDLKTVGVLVGAAAAAGKLFAPPAVGAGVVAPGVSVQSVAPKIPIDLNGSPIYTP